MSKPHGIRGDVAAEIGTDFPERLVAGITVGVGESLPERSLVVESVRLHKGGWLLRLSGITTREDADTLRGSWLFLPEQERASLPENFYYEHELLGWRCVLVSGVDVGPVVAVDHGPGGALLSVETGDPVQVVLIPFVSPIVVSVNSEQGVIVIDPPAGLVDGDAV